MVLGPTRPPLSFRVPGGTGFNDWSSEGITQGCNMHCQLRLYDSIPFLLTYVHRSCLPSAEPTFTLCHSLYNELSKPLTRAHSTLPELFHSLEIIFC